MYRPSMQQLDALIDMIVEAIASDIVDAENEARLTANTGPPDQGERGIQEKTEDDNHS